MLLLRSIVVLKEGAEANTRVVVPGILKIRRAVNKR